MSDKLSDRWTSLQRDIAFQIVNDIAEDIDNRETRSELRQALAIYADLLCDALEEKAFKKTDDVIGSVTKLIELMEQNRKSQIK